MIEKLTIEDYDKKVLMRKEEDGSVKILVSGGIYEINCVSVDILHMLNKKMNIKDIVKTPLS